MVNNHGKSYGKISQKTSMENYHGKLLRQISIVIQHGKLTWQINIKNIMEINMAN